MALPLKILFVEDVPADADLAALELRRAGIDCTVQRVQDRGAMLRALQEFQPDLIVSDHSLPNFSARDALELAQHEASSTPVIVVTGSIDEETAADYIKAGAVDYVVKQRMHRLPPAVRRALEFKQARKEAADAEAARQQSENRFRKLVEYSSDVITLLDQQGTIRYSSQSMLTALGYRPEAVVGRPVVELIHPVDRIAAQRMFSEVFESPDRVTRADLRALHQSGSWRLLEVVAMNRLSDPAIAAVVVNYHDITERKRAEEGLRQVSDDLRALIEASPLAIYSLSLEGTIRSWNAAAERIFGWPASEVDGQPLPSVPEEQRAEDDALNQRVLRGELLSGIEVVRRRKDGRAVQIRLSAGPLFDATGHVTGIMAVAADVTEVKQLEDQYRQAQKMEVVGKLAGGVAHDFNNILTAISGYCELLLDDVPAGDPKRPDLEEIRKATGRAASLTRQLLAFSRQQVLAPQILDVNRLVKEMENMLRRLLGEDVALRVRLGAHLGEVRADQGQLEQVIMNLAVNARDAMPRGGHLTIETINVQLEPTYAEFQLPAQPGPYVMVAVSDTGTGMDEDTRSRIFEPFFTTKDKGKGTGLGLSTVYGIVKQTGGYVWVYSELGQGTTFKVYLPQTTGAEKPEPVNPEEPPVVGGTETILLVEDEAPVRAVVAQALTRQGYTVLEAADVQTAIALGDRHAGPIQLLVTDLVMPEINGTELATRLIRARPDLRVLLMSGYTDDTVSRHATPVPNLTYLQKPFGLDTLARKVRQALA